MGLAMGLNLSTEQESIVHALDRIPYLLLSTQRLRQYVIKRPC